MLCGTWMIVAQGYCLILMSPMIRYFALLHCAQRFGDIKGIRLVRAVAAGEEILVDYGYFDEVHKDVYARRHQENPENSLLRPAQSRC